MMFVDLPDGSLIMIPGHNVMVAAKLAECNHGRARLVVSHGMSTADCMAGCIQIADYRMGSDTGDTCA